MTPDQICYLKLHYGTAANKTLAAVMGLTIAEIYQEAQRLSLGKDKKRFAANRMPRWTVEEIKYLRKYYSTWPNEKIASRMERTTKSVLAKAHKLGLKKRLDRLQQMGRDNVKLRRDRPY